MDMKLQQVQVLKPQLTQELRQAITLLGYQFGRTRRIH